MGDAAYRSGLYKVSMVRMENLTNSRRKGSTDDLGRNALTVKTGCVGLSKNGCYEIPCGVTGNAQRTGPKGSLKTYVQIGISERGKP